MLSIDPYTRDSILLSLSVKDWLFRDELPLGWGGWPLIDHWHSSLSHC